MVLIQEVNDPLPVPICVDNFSYSISMNVICKSLGFIGGHGRVEVISNQIPQKKLVSCDEVILSLVVFFTFTTHSAVL